MIIKELMNVHNMDN